MTIRKTAQTWLGVLLLAGFAVAQAPSSTSPSATPLTLPQAVAIALEKNPARKAVLAEQNIAGANVREARSALLPRLTFSETATRGNDPVYVFGTRLRQQRFTVQDFALNRLNTPTPVGNFSTRLGGNWSLFDSFASWMGVSRARQMQDAAAQQLERTDQELIYHAVQAYFGLLLAAKQEQVAEQAMQTAQSIHDLGQAKYEAGLTVESDFLSAQVNLASRRQQLIEARNQVSLAQAQLNNALGLSSDVEYQPAEVLAERTLPLAPLNELEADALHQRPDLKRLQAEQAAQEKGVAIAKASFGPRVNVFGSWEADNPAFTGGGGNNWVGGIELQVDLFQGGAKKARLAREHAAQEQIAAMIQSAQNDVRLDVRRAYYQADTARQQVAVARASTAQAQESLRINQNRYEAGLATITDLLRVEEASRRAQADYWDAVYRLQTSYANLELAAGILSRQSAVVTP